MISVQHEMETPDITDKGANTTLGPERLRTTSYRYIDAHFRGPELARFLAWIRQGPGAATTWGGARWERGRTPKLQLAMAVCKALSLKVIQQNPQTGTTWARLAREGHDVWQVLTATGSYLGVIVDGVYHSYEEIDHTGREQGRQGRGRGAHGSPTHIQDRWQGQ